MKTHATKVNERCRVRGRFLVEARDKNKGESFQKHNTSQDV